MAIEVLKNQKLWFGGYDFTGRMNALALESGVELQDGTVFGDTARRRLAGLKSVIANHEGYFDAELVDKPLFDAIGIVDQPMTFGPVDGVEGSLAYTFAAIIGQYSPGGQVGELFAFTVSAEGSDGSELIRGTLMHNAARTVTADGTARQLGAVSASQKLYAALHVITVAGSTPTLDVKVQSDDASGFPSPTDRITFTQKTAIGAKWATPVAGVIDDDWWRITWTIGGGSPSFTFVVVVGIQ